MITSMHSCIGFKLNSTVWACEG